MRLQRAMQFEEHLEVVIDARLFTEGEKYTILELGYANYLSREPPVMMTRCGYEPLEKPFRPIHPMVCPNCALGMVDSLHLTPFSSH